MKRTFLIMLIFVLAFSVKVSAQPQDLAEKERHARHIAEKVLAGRQIAVRVYNNWQGDPRSYKLISVPLAGLWVHADAVKSAYGQMSDSAILVVQADDQADDAVAAVIGEFIYAGPYQVGASFYIWAWFSKRLLFKPHLFNDAAGNPLSGATVEIMIGQYASFKSRGPRVSIRKAKLDDQSRLPALKAGSTLREFSFLLWHPDYGPEPVPAGSPDRHDEPLWTHSVPVLPMDKWCVFKDALGNAIPNATVEVFQGVEWRKDIPGLAATVKLDEKGRLKPLLSDPKLEYCYFIVSHPDYGTALAEPRRFIRTDGPLAKCIVPMVRKGTEADSRSVWGKVTDRDGNPVADAVIICDNLVSADGSLLRLAGFSLQQVRAITDRQGQFAFYMPITVEGQLQLVPPGAKYYLSIHSPEGLNLIPYSGSVPSGQETTIVMRRELPQTQTFIFEDEFGPVTDPNMLRQIRLEIVNDNGQRFGDTFSFLLERGKFQPGTYYATADWNGKHYVFEPVYLSEKNAGTVVFRPAKIEPSEMIYRGTVVHGITAQPISGVLVLKHPHISDVNLSGLDHKKIEAIVEAIEQIGPELEPNDPVFEMLDENFKSKMTSRTDASGNFQITLPNTNILPVQRIIAVKKDFLGAVQQLCGPGPANGLYWHRLVKILPEQDGYVTVPAMRLFPAGTIIIEPNLPADSKARRFTLNWFTFPGDKPAWFEAMGDYTNPSKNQGASLFYRHHLLPSGIQKVYVAAGLEMTLQIQVQSESQWDPVVVPNIKLQQGQVLNLGRVDFGPALRVAVKVIDSTGQPVEGITVWLMGENGLFQGCRAVTDADGVAFLNVPLYSRGQFVVQYFDSTLPDKRLQEGTAYQVAGQEDAGREFTLHLSDEILNLLFK